MRNFSLLTPYSLSHSHPKYFFPPPPVTWLASQNLFDQFSDPSPSSLNCMTVSSLSVNHVLEQLSPVWLCVVGRVVQPDAVGRVGDLDHLRRGQHLQIKPMLGLTVIRFGTSCFFFISDSISITDPFPKSLAYSHSRSINPRQIYNVIPYRPVSWT